MGQFQRSPSKVWWSENDSLNASLNHSLNWRAASGSPGSQDSGFSDTENNNNSPIISALLTTNDLQKSDSTRKQNLTDNDNINEKLTPKTSIDDCFCLANDTPVRRPEVQAKSEPAVRFIKNKNYQKVSRNLFRSIQMQESVILEVDATANQYSSDKPTPISSQITSQNNSIPANNQSLPNTAACVTFDNLSAPAILYENYADQEAVTSFNQASVSSDSFNRSDNSNSSNRSGSSNSDSELEGIFQQHFDALTHTSTPKHALVLKKDAPHKLGKIHAMNLLHKYRNERVPPISVETAEEGTALKQWMEEVKHSYEPECMTTLQCKSIAGELANNIAQLAAISTTTIRLILNYDKLIQNEFDHFKNDNSNQTHSLTGLIEEFLEKFKLQSNLQGKCHELRANNDDKNKLKLVNEMHVAWDLLQSALIRKEIDAIIKGVANPTSEIDVRVKLTGLTSIALRNETLIKQLVDDKRALLRSICLICETSAGSSVRALAFRCLSTLCVNACAIRQLEQSAGMRIITECLGETSRPEPERAEAVALLAQITAPWIEDNHTIKGLHTHAKSLIKALTKLISNTQCCQNLLLCTAALANVTTMDVKSIKHLINQATARLLINRIKHGGNNASIYLFEQLATLITNMAGDADARVVLAQDGAAAGALLCFLHATCLDEEVVRRLQQKAVIGLSRLCGEPVAAQQVVQMGGVERIVKLCKEKSARFDSDAILVAALATLRKIAEVCGLEVVNEEDAQELIQPKLLDSFRAYSAQKQSLV